MGVRLRPAVIFGSDGIEKGVNILCLKSFLMLLTKLEGNGSKINIIEHRDYSITMRILVVEHRWNFNEKENRYNYELIFLKKELVCWWKIQY